MSVCFRSPVAVEDLGSWVLGRDSTANRRDLVLDASPCDNWTRVATEGEELAVSDGPIWWATNIDGTGVVQCERCKQELSENVTAEEAQHLWELHEPSCPGESQGQIDPGLQ
jgi:hypothetical protein